MNRHEEKPRLTVMAIRELDTTPQPAPPPASVEKTVETPVPAFVPKPEIQLPAPGPVKVALDMPPPPVHVATAAVPQPVAVAAPASAPAPAAGAHEGGDLSGKALFINPPVYPVQARRQREQGTVKLLVLVGVDGRVEDIEIASSSGSTALDRAALRAVRHWRWEPVSRNGTAMAVRGYVVIPFVLKTQDA
ncbi:TonB family protein [Novosphingobium sp. 2580]|uniref:Protein TonB n=1 Tax=Novosphingobium album (ex Hu et al. 2023) TaxID=2930093 RepID=A0ABT0B065_9SPHN|nr:TonB family protein [Novosphingobium album (ex Hu et al. 2023)]